MSFQAYTLYALNMNDTSAGTDDYLIDQVEAFSLNPGVTPAIMNSDGNVDPTFAATMAVKPTLNLTTSKVATMLAKASSAFLINGQALANGAFNAEGWFYKLDEGGTRATGTVHKKMVVTKGMVLPRQIRATQEAHATLDLDIIATQDGTTAPVVISDADLTGTPAVSELFTLGPVKINGTTQNAISGVTIDPGIQEFVQTSDGKAYPQGMAIMSRAPSITFELADLAALTSITLDGLDLATGADIYLRKIESGGVRVSDVTAEHIKITVGAGMAHMETVSVNHNGHAVPGVRISPIKPGGSILTVDTTSAIT